MTIILSTDRSDSLRTSAECLAKAVEMQARAAECGEAELHGKFQRLAVYWRDLGHQATYQDAMERHMNNDEPKLNT